MAANSNINRNTAIITPQIVNASATGAHNGANTHSHDQPITLVSLSITNNSANIGNIGNDNVTLCSMSLLMIFFHPIVYLCLGLSCVATSNLSTHTRVVFPPVFSLHIVPQNSQQCKLKVLNG